MAPIPREDPCPYGKWLVDWKTSMRKYVRPQVADEVEKVLALLKGKDADAFQEISQRHGVSQGLVDGLKQGAEALMDFLSL